MVPRSSGLIESSLTTVSFSAQYEQKRAGSESVIPWKQTRASSVELVAEMGGSGLPQFVHWSGTRMGGASHGRTFL